MTMVSFSGALPPQETRNGRVAIIRVKTEEITTVESFLLTCVLLSKILTVYDSNLISSCTSDTRIDSSFYINLKGSSRIKKIRVVQDGDG